MDAKLDFMGTLKVQERVDTHGVKTYYVSLEGMFSDGTSRIFSLPFTDAEWKRMRPELLDSIINFLDPSFPTS